MNRRAIGRILPHTVVSLLCAILTGCGLPYCDKTKFTEDELKWMSAYKEGDKLMFYNTATEERDTMQIKKVEIFNPRNTLWFDLEGCNWLEGDNTFHAIARYDFILKHNGVDYRGSFTIRKPDCKEPAKISVAALGNYSSRLSCKSGKQMDDDINSKCNTCITFYKGQFERGLHQPVLDLDYLIWNQQEGLVAYKLYCDSEPYVLRNSNTKN